MRKCSAISVRSFVPSVPFRIVIAARLKKPLSASNALNLSLIVDISLGLKKAILHLIAQCSSQGSSTNQEDMIFRLRNRKLMHLEYQIHLIQFHEYNAQSLPFGGFSWDYPDVIFRSRMKTTVISSHGILQHLLHYLLS
ncbi:hypothetical protein Leryth_026256 [Lithospermum erythrorhizon]|nr:hypothetical protein Leryth_026256 [Lithospermum erythrorhizon]